MEHPPTREESNSPDDKNTTSERPCLACGYDLRGLGDEPRCPECGLLNVPEGYRKQVQDLVDSGKWFFSNPLTPWRKRQPGWFWSLDRDGDLRRSTRYAAIMMIAAMAIIWGGGFALCNIGFVESWDMSGKLGGQPIRYTHSYRYGVGWGVGHEATDPPELLGRLSSADVLKRPTAIRVEWWPVDDWWHVPAFASVWVLSAWIGPGVVGLVTQIRRRMRGFSRPLRSVVSAVNFEAHLMVWLALCTVLTYGVASIAAFEWREARLGVWAPTFVAANYDLVLNLLLLLPPLCAVLVWVGPVRSDSTGQLIRGNLHAIRILILYALAGPLIVVLAAFYLLFVFSEVLG